MKMIWKKVIRRQSQRLTSKKTWKSYILLVFLKNQKSGTTDPSSHFQAWGKKFSESSWNFLWENILFSFCLKFAWDCISQQTIKSFLKFYKFIWRTTSVTAQRPHYSSQTPVHVTTWREAPLWPPSSPCFLVLGCTDWCEPSPQCWRKTIDRECC